MNRTLFALVGMVVIVGAGVGWMLPSWSAPRPYVDSHFTRVATAEAKEQIVAPSAPPADAPPETVATVQEIKNEAASASTAYLAYPCSDEVRARWQAARRAYFSARAGGILPNGQPAPEWSDAQDRRIGQLFLKVQGTHPNESTTTSGLSPEWSGNQAARELVARIQSEEDSNTPDVTRGCSTQTQGRS